MIDLFFTGFSLFITLEVVGLILNKLKSKQLEYQESLDNFEVRLDNGISILFLISALFFGFCAYGASISDIDHGYYFWYAFAAVSVVSSILILMSFQKLKVDGNNIIYTQYLFPKRLHLTFSDITHYSIFGDTLKIYKNQKKLFSLDCDMTGYKNFLDRLKRENIKCSEDGVSTRTIKKNDIFFRNTSAIGIIVLMLVISVFMVIPTFAQSISENNLYEAITESIITILIMLGVGLFAASFVTIPYYININKIEKGLGITFDEEMKKLGVTWFDYKDEKWYIQGINFIVCRDYIESIENINFRSGGDNSADTYDFYLRTKDGKRIKLSSTNKDDFKSWFYKTKI